MTRTRTNQCLWWKVTWSWNPARTLGSMKSDLLFFLTSVNKRSRLNPSHERWVQWEEFFILLEWVLLLWHHEKTNRRNFRRNKIQLNKREKTWRQRRRVWPRAVKHPQTSWGRETSAGCCRGVGGKEAPPLSSRFLFPDCDSFSFWCWACIARTVAPTGTRDLWRLSRPFL